jgi:hypothetical protein
MRALRCFWLLASLALLGLASAPAPAGADFGLLPGSEGFDVSVLRNGTPLSDAGAHPDRMAVHIAFETEGPYPAGDPREIALDLPEGMLANPAALQECSQVQFAAPRSSPYEASLSGESCPDTAQVGTIAVALANGTTRHFGLYNLAAPYGDAEAIGAAPFGVPIVFAAHLRDPASLTFELQNLSQALGIASIDLDLWGTPWDYRHDVERGNCLNEEDPAAYHGSASFWEAGDPPKFHTGTCHIPIAGVSLAFPFGQFVDSYLTLPTACGAKMKWSLRASSWQQGGSAEASVLSPSVLADCLEILTRVKTQLRTERAAAATGIVFDLDVNDGGGFTNADGRVRSPIQSVRALLPEGLTINPSLGAGLGVCTEAEFGRESATSAPGSGCPNNSKIGSVGAEGLLGLPEALSGSVFLAKPYANPSHSPIALYIALASPRRGLFFGSFATVSPDPATGRLAIAFENLPPVHYDRFALSLREGQRAAAISPPTCGSHLAQLQYRPWSDPALVLEDSSSFLISQGEDGGACPSGGRPFRPALQAGSENTTAGFYSPFQLRMTRTDAEQEITSYSATFPPGLLGKLAGVGVCPEAAIAAAAARRGERGGVEELQAPSCPASSSIGHTIAGYGVGGTLAYAPGALYLAGPYRGSPLSTVAIDSALVGPFDLGVVVVRSAIRVDPRTAQVSIDSSGSDPIPHIIKGIPIHLRDIRVAIDRPNFTVNPTSCDTLATTSTLSGSGASFFSPADDVSATAANRFQLSDCSGFGIEAKLRLALSGPTTRGRYPQLEATYLPRPGDANLKQATVALPRTLFLAQEHIDEICTLPRFRAKTCPAGSRLGTASARTPLMEEPLKGFVYARANPGKLLPDIVADLSGRGIEIEVVGHIGKGATGGLKASFDSLPDAPVSKFAMKLFGGKRGLLVNAGNLCAAPQRADARFVAHNNATEAFAPKLKVDCKTKKKKRKAGKRR